MQAAELSRVVGQNVRRRRLELGMTQIDLATKTGMQYPEISEIERGKRAATLTTIARLAEGLSIPPAHLLSAEAVVTP